MTITVGQEQLGTMRLLIIMLLCDTSSLGSDLELLML